MANKLIDKAIVKLKTKYEFNDVNTKDELMDELKIKLIMDKTKCYNHFRAIIGEDSDIEVLINKTKNLQGDIYKIDELEDDINRFNQLITMEA